MKILSTVVSVLAIASTVSLSACVSMMGPGDSASATPPRLVSGGRGVSTSDSMAWDRADAFGPVPADMKVKGQAACDRLQGAGWTPTGYHPMAQYADGTTSPTGGYYCQKR